MFKGSRGEYQCTRDTSTSLPSCFIQRQLNPATVSPSVHTFSLPVCDPEVWLFPSIGHCRYLLQQGSRLGTWPMELTVLDCDYNRGDAWEDYFSYCLFAQHFNTWILLICLIFSKCDTMLAMHKSTQLYNDLTSSSSSSPAVVLTFTVIMHPLSLSFTHRFEGRLFNKLSATN